MPAINLTRLRMHTAELAEHFADSGKFVHELEGFLEFYADRTRRVGLAGITPTLIRAYNIPREAMNQLLRELKDHIDLDNQAALDLVNMLWNVETLETRVIAARILGMVEQNDPQIVLGRLEKWISVNEEEKITQAISKYAVEPLITQYPGKYLEFLAAGLASEFQLSKLYTLQAYTDLAKDENFEDLPAILRSLNECIQDYHSSLKLPLLELLTALAIRTPGETAFFLRYNMAQAPTEDLIWIGRSVIKHLPEDIEEGIHELFHEF